MNGSEAILKNELHLLFRKKWENKMSVQATIQYKQILLELFCQSKSEAG